MVLKPLGEKVVNILVNGTQEESYTQDQTENDYNISISNNLALNKVENRTFKYGEEIDTGNPYPNDRTDTVEFERYFYPDSTIGLMNLDVEVYLRGSSDSDDTVEIFLNGDSVYYTEHYNVGYSDNFNVDFILDTQNTKEITLTSEVNGNKSAMHWVINEHFAEIDDNVTQVDAVTQS